MKLRQVDSFCYRMRLMADEHIASVCPPEVARRWTEGRLTGRALTIRMVMVMSVPRWAEWEGTGSGTPRARIR